MDSGTPYMDLLDASIEDLNFASVSSAVRQLDSQSLPDVANLPPERPTYRSLPFNRRIPSRLEEMNQRHGEMIKQLQHIELEIKKFRLHLQKTIRVLQKKNQLLTDRNNSLLATVLEDKEEP